MIEKIKSINKGCLVAMALCIACVVAFAYYINAFYPTSPVKATALALKVELPTGTSIISDYYEEPSFPTGDGYTWTVLQVPPEKIYEFVDSLRTSPYWKPLPLPGELANQEYYLQPAIMFGLEGSIPISEATGYYFFIDRQEEYNKKHYRQTYDTSIPFSERSSYNYTFSLFNDKDGKLYFWSVNT